MGDRLMGDPHGACSWCLTLMVLGGSAVARHLELHYSTVSRLIKSATKEQE